MTPTRRAALWLGLIGVVAMLTNALAVYISIRTFGAMGGVSEFALAVREQDARYGDAFNLVVFPTVFASVIAYLWPVFRFVRAGAPPPAPLVVQRRIIGVPLVVAGLGFAAWAVACVAFPALTIVNFGHWSLDLMSQQVLSRLVAGFLAATTTYLLVDWLVRGRLAPLLLPGGQLASVPSALALGVRARLLVFLLAVAFTPLFTMLGLVRAAVVRVDRGLPVERVMDVLGSASATTFWAYVGLGVGLTLILARTLTRPLAEVAVALRRVQGGDLDARVPVNSSDELGVVQDGVNAMVDTLRDKERILGVFGRVVEPSVRDQLLRGDLQLGGQMRVASVLFCDLRGFTAFAERTPPDAVVATLNAFFSTMTECVRESGGFVDKFIGDAMMVVFGLFGTAPDGDHGAAAAALRCGLGMRERLAVLNASRAAAGQPSLAVAVSIHTGEVLSGRIGAEDRHEYTVIGDTVNIAARLQHLCKEQGCDLLFTETTYECARRVGFDERVSQLDTVVLRGRSTPVRVFGIA